MSQFNEIQFILYQLPEEEKSGCFQNENNHSKFQLPRKSRQHTNKLTISND